MTSILLSKPVISIRKRHLSTRIHSNSLKLVPLSFYHKNKPQFTSGFRFQVENKKNIILYPEGKVELNSSAGRIFELCTGNKTIEDIKEIVNEEYSIDNSDIINTDIDNILKDAVLKNWIKLI